MSTEPPSSHQMSFAPLHRTVELENIHAQVTNNDLHEQPQERIPSTRKVLTRYMTVIGDGSDTNTENITTQ
ncbi:unnamed protein product [Adineta steineri]|uniref:Uncharacterized protein n=1 Tax=Adineta steineri TaxID=433720 RepID=A0A815K9U8_9BILA|nr:unnamed protein product [Adineta steineri]CAF3991857.1 unnamed protein product [Adineta steineri]